jgi:hypothetical protein
MATMGCDCSSPGGARVRLAERSSTKFGPLSPTATPAFFLAEGKTDQKRSARAGLPAHQQPYLAAAPPSELLFPTRHGSSPFSSSPRAARRGAAASWSLTIRYCRWDRGRWWPPRPAAHVSFFTGCRLLPCAADADAAAPDPSSGRTDRDASSSASRGSRATCRGCSRWAHPAAALLPSPDLFAFGSGFLQLLPIDPRVQMNLRVR